MQQFKPFLFGLILVGLGSCSHKITEEDHVDRVVYEVNGGKIYQTNAEKVKAKSSLQFISVLYAQVFERPIGVTELLELESLAQSIGDKGMYFEILMGSFLQDAEASLWTEEFMQSNPEQFTDELFLRFFNREPDAYEMHEFVQRIQEGYNFSDLYWGVLLANEYKYY